jgi:NADH-quinone oxidoreductase subunit G
MAQVTINGKAYEFKKGERILEVALRNNVTIPHYCYHPSLSIPANCRICLAEVWAPNRAGKLEAMPQLKATCHTECSDGMVIYTDSPRSMANQKAVMEFLLINHPVDCPVCDKAGECYLQDYSYEYGRGQSRFLEEKVKNPKKDIGSNILLYSDRCIMCTRCVRFTREVSGTDELMVDGRGDREMIDVFPGRALENELAGNVVDICPVGALLDKNFLFQQRVWFLTRTPSIDGLTASGDNIFVNHNDGKVHRITPRTNMDVNTWWITDEVRYSWKHVHSEQRLRMPRVKGMAPFAQDQSAQAWRAGLARASGVVADAVNARKRTALVVSPMLSCEDAFELATWIMAMDRTAMLAVGPVPFRGENKTFKSGFTLYAEKAPNARGVRRVLEAVAAQSGAGKVEDFAGFQAALQSKQFGAVVMTGNYPSDWVTPQLRDSLMATPLVLIDTLETSLCNLADVVLPGATWCEKDGSFQNVKDRVQAFERAIVPVDFCRSEAQIGADLRQVLDAAGTRAGAGAGAGSGSAAAVRAGFARPVPPHASGAQPYNSARATKPRVHAAAIRSRMAQVPGLDALTKDVHEPSTGLEQASDMAFAEL